MKTSSLVALLLLFLFPVYGQMPKIVLQTFASGFSSPVDIANCTDSRLFIVQRLGKIYIIDSNGVKNLVPFLDISKRVNNSNDERGLLGIAFHPDYKKNGYFYVNYVTRTPGVGYTRISRFTRDSTNENIADTNSEKILLTIYQPFANHKGGCLKFGHDGFLYDSQGDGGSGGDPGNRAQNGDTLLGKILRIDVDHGDPYSIPDNNPFVNGNGRPEIWALGLRNPWRYSFDRLTGDLWIGDVGQSKWEEIDFQPAVDTGGENYGWHCYEGNHTYLPLSCNNSLAGLTFPVYEYPHVSGAECSVTGGFVYRGTKYKNLFGKYLFMDFCSGILWMMQDSSGVNIAKQLGNFDNSNFGSFGEDRYGELYLVEVAAGKIMRITDTSSYQPVAYIPSTDTITKCSYSAVSLHLYEGTPFNYQWELNGKDIDGATNTGYSALDSGSYRVKVTNPENGYSDTSNAVTVRNYPEPDIQFTLPSSGNKPGLFCANSSNEFVLTASPAGGTFSGDRISGDTLRANLFSHDTSLIIYTITDSHSCIVSKSDTAIVVHPYNDIQFTLPSSGNRPGLFCGNLSNEFVLTATPTGGTFSGDGISVDTLRANLFSHDTSLITYTFTDSNSCAVSKSDTAILFHSNNEIQFTLPNGNYSYCSNFHIDFNLSATPSGGIFSGKYVHGDTLKPYEAFLGNPEDTSLITYTYADINGCSFSVTDTAYIEICGKINSVFGKRFIEIFPNPSDGKIQVSYQFSNPEKATIKIFNSIGKIVLSEEKNLAKGNSEFSIDISDKPEGLYLLQMSAGGKMETSKIILLKN